MGHDDSDRQLRRPPRLSPRARRPRDVRGDDRHPRGRDRAVARQILHRDEGHRRRGGRTKRTRGMGREGRPGATAHPATPGCIRPASAMERCRHVPRDRRDDGGCAAVAIAVANGAANSPCIPGSPTPPPSAPHCASTHACAVAGPSSRWNSAPSTRPRQAATVLGGAGCERINGVGVPRRRRGRLPRAGGMQVGAQDPESGLRHRIAAVVPPLVVAVVGGSGGGGSKCGDGYGGGGEGGGGEREGVRRRRGRRRRGGGGTRRDAHLRTALFR